MLEIFIIGILAVTLLAKRNYTKKSYHRSYRLRRVRLTPSLGLGTLATLTALTVAVTPASSSTYRCISIDTVWNGVGVTQTGGPFTVGYAHSDYSVGEIKECIEASAAIDVGNKVASEQANRLVRIVGTMDFDVAFRGDLNDGKPVKTRLNWLIAIGQSVNAFVYNEGTVAITGSTLKLTGNMYVKDSA